MGAENLSVPRGTERCLRKTTCAYVVAEADLPEVDRARIQGTLSRSRRNIERDEPEEGLDTFSFECVVRGCEAYVEIVKRQDEARPKSYFIDNEDTCKRV